MPLIIQGNLYQGIIKTKWRRYFINTFLLDPSVWKANDLVIDCRLFKLLDGLLDEFIEKNSNCCDYIEFFGKLEKFVKSSLVQEEEKSNLQTISPLKAYNLYKCISEELKQIEEYIKDFEIEEDVIHMEVQDSASRVHKASIKISQSYPKEPVKVINHNLPIQEDNPMRKNVNFLSVNTITGFCKRFAQCIDYFQEFWNCVSIIDTNCWILDPENPTYKDITRRIKISDRISVVLIFNAYQGRQRPHIKFLGCHSTVAEFREILQRNLENEIWNPEDDLLNNLMNVLEVKFPPKPEAIDNDSMNLVKSGECAICFLTRLNDEIPSEICDNSNCLSNYHTSCLFNYLMLVPTNRNYFGRIQGECPNCDHIISCQIPSFN